MDPVTFFKNLAEETRLSILMMTFVETELCVCEFVQAMELSQPKISRHLAQLRQHGLLTDRKSGKWVFYSISPDLKQWQKECLSVCVANNQDYIKPYQAKLHEWGSRPNRQQECC
ncbi:metalloregulator ArsR/SmtB family transcription factor [Pseudocolwellia sp. HL-MZ19]|uniref:metalloregulator ArsR/SmtB family transcription factor n=1 Tax=unclassified Pseudocolwellia TaxID=2848178 RepID=UPI003CE87A15